MFYVYEWYNVDTDEVFYVGKGTGNRYKQTSKRNKKFQQYYENHECAVRIVKYFELEEDAFNYGLIAEVSEMILENPGVDMVTLDKWIRNEWDI